MSRTELLFRASLLISLLITFGIGITSVLLGFDILLLLFAAILTILLIMTLRLGQKLRCRDVWALYNELILNQRNSLAWYVGNAMHGFNPPAYQLILVESLYEKGRTLHTELAKLKMIAEEEARKEIATEIQMQLDEWEVIILQLQSRIDELAPKHRL
jgi:hypothetical protein